MSKSRQAWIGRFAVSALVLYWLALLVGTHIPQPLLPQGSGNDKLLHFGAYAGLALLFSTAAASQRAMTWRLLAVIYLLLIGYGMLDEITQWPIPGRYAEMNDWLADCLGAAVGTGLFSLGYWSWKMRSDRIIEPDAGR